MKTCPECGDGFVGFEQKCPVCRRRPESKRSPVNLDCQDPVSGGIGKQRRPGVPAMLEALKAMLVVGEPCPCCERKYRPRTSDADRQRRYRERRKANGTSISE